MTLRVPIADIRPDSKQPRRYFRESALKALATSIKKTGQRQPITVRRRKAGAKPPYEIIDGERRWRACKLAGIATIRIDIEERDTTRHADQHLLSLTSNFVREGHTHMEISEAVVYQVDDMITNGQTRGQAVQALAEALGKSEAWIYQYLQLQNLCADLQQRMHPDVVDDKRLRFNEAIVLAPLNATQQKTLFRKLLRYPPGARAQLAKRLVAEATGVPIKRKQHNVKVSTERFIVRIGAEIERVLDYKQSDFIAALSAIPIVDLKDLRKTVGHLATSLDRALEQLQPRSMKTAPMCTAANDASARPPGQRKLGNGPMARI